MASFKPFDTAKRFKGRYTHAHTHPFFYRFLKVSALTPILSFINIASLYLETEPLLACPRWRLTHPEGVKGSSIAVPPKKGTKALCCSGFGPF